MALKLIGDSKIYAKDLKVEQFILLGTLFGDTKTYQITHIEKRNSGLFITAMEMGGFFEERLVILSENALVRITQGDL